MKTVLRVMKENDLSVSKLKRLCSVSLPYECDVYFEGQCIGNKKDSGLYTRCLKKEWKDGCCKNCRKWKRGEGEPPHGRFDGSVKRVRWIEYLKKENLTKEDGLDALELNGFVRDFLDKTSEFEMQVKEKKKGKSGNGTTDRFVPLKGKSKSVSRASGNYWKHEESDTGCRVRFYKETGKIEKISGSKWPQGAHDKFVELYGEPDKEGFGKEKTKNKKKKNTNTELEEMQLKYQQMMKEKKDQKEEMERLKQVEKENEEFRKKLDMMKQKKIKKKPTRLESIDKEIEEARAAASAAEKTGDETVEDEARDLLRKLKKEKKKLLEAKEEEHKEEVHKEEVADSSEEDIENFTSDDEDDAFVFNPYTYKNIKYHLENTELYMYPPTEEGSMDIFGTLNEDGTVTEC